MLARWGTTELRPDGRATTTDRESASANTRVGGGEVVGASRIERSEGDAHDFARAAGSPSGSPDAPGARRSRESAGPARQGLASRSGGGGVRGGRPVQPSGWLLLRPSPPRGSPATKAECGCDVPAIPAPFRLATSAVGTRGKGWRLPRSACPALAQGRSEAMARATDLGQIRTVVAYAGRGHEPDGPWNRGLRPQPGARSRSDVAAYRRRAQPVAFRVTAPTRHLQTTDGLLRRKLSPGDRAAPRPESHGCRRPLFRASPDARPSPRPHTR